MAIEDEEQKEILLGNKQLLSIFFIVVVLLGVSFTIGYIIGKNTATMHAAEPAKTAAVTQAETQPPSSPSAAEAAQSREDPDPAPIVSPRAAVPKPSPPTHPAKAYDAETAPAPSETADKAPDATPAAAGGSYLQVGALKREDADNIAKVLRSRGYPTVLGESSKEGLFRVLVGPFKNMADLAESKQKLKASGMDSFIVK